MRNSPPNLYVWLPLTHVRLVLKVGFSYIRGSRFPAVPSDFTPPWPPQVETTVPLLVPAGQSPDQPPNRRLTGTPVSPISAVGFQFAVSELSLKLLDR